MGVQIETLVICDGPGCGEVYANGDTRHEPASAQRDGYWQDGWRFVTNRDYCPKCAAKLQSKPRAKKA